MDVKVSIIIPVYNVEKFLERCVNSVLSQTIQNFEVILIDDGSTDMSPMLCDKFAESDQRIVTRHIKNGGVSNARNLGIKLSQGEYICFIDSDDWIDSNYLQTLLNSSDADLSAVSLICEFTDKTISHKFSKSGLFRGDNLSSYYNENLSGLVALSPCGKLYRKEVIIDNDILFPANISFAEDAIFNINYYLKCKSIYLNKETLYHYRMTGSGLTSNSVSHHKEFEHTLKIILLLIEELNKISNYSLDTKEIGSALTLQFFIREFKYAIAMRHRKDCIDALMKIANCESFKLNFDNYPKGKSGVKAKVINMLFRHKALIIIYIYIYIMRAVRLQPY